MPVPTTTLNARIKQKLATEAYWLSIETELGPILEGEQAFVYDVAGNPLNFKIGDGTKLFSQLPYFIAYYSNVTNQKVLGYVNQNSNITISGVFKNNSFIQGVVFINNSGGNIDLKIGTSNGGNDIFEITLPVGVSTIDAKYFFTSANVLYITGLTSSNSTLFLLYYQLDESPAIPPTTQAGITSKFAFGTIYPFYPMYTGHENAVWDFVSGMGKTGTDYTGCTLMSYNGLDNLNNYLLNGYAPGDTLGGDKGSNILTIAKANLPAVGLPMFAVNVNNTNGDAPNTTTPVARAASDGNPLSYELRRGTVDPTIGLTGKMGSGTSLVNQPLSKAVLFFTGPQTTT